MRDRIVFLRYDMIRRRRALRSIVKNLYIGLSIVVGISSFMVFQIWKMVSLNINVIHYYRHTILLILTVILFAFTLFYKKPPFEFHPASMLHLSGEKFQTMITYHLCKKVVSSLVISFLMAGVLVKCDLCLELLSMQVVIWNLLFFSVAIRHRIYHKGIDIKLCVILSSHSLLLNAIIYLPISLCIPLLFLMSFVSVYYMQRALTIVLDFNKLFIELSNINKVKYLARGNNLSDAQEFLREHSAQKHRKNAILKMVRCKDPLIQKHIITFFRINLFAPLYLSVILAIVIILYQFEVFAFVKAMKASGTAIKVVAFHQGLVINNIVELITSQKNLLMIKSKEGLYLPYSKMEIVNSFFIVGLPMIGFETFLVGLLLKVSVFKICTACLSYGIVFYIYLLFEKKKKQDMLRFGIYSAMILVSYHFLK